MIKNVHVVIGCGPLGRATAQALKQAGCEVVLINRSGNLENPPAGVTLCALDILAHDRLPKELEDCVAIHFCAQPAYHRWVEEFSALQEAAITLAVNASARLIVAENLYGYGVVTSPMSEDFPLKPHTRKGRVRAEMHERLMKEHRAGVLQVAVARGSDFFGPYVYHSAVGARTFDAIVAGKPAEVIGDPDALHDYTYVEDFGRAMAILGTDERALGEVWHVPNAQTVTTRQFLELSFRYAQHLPEFRRLKKIHLMIAGLFIPPARETIEMLYEFEMPFRVNHDKFVKTFGNIATPFEKSLQHTVKWAQLKQGEKEAKQHNHP